MKKTLRVVVFAVFARQGGFTEGYAFPNVAREERIQQKIDKKHRQSIGSGANKLFFNHCLIVKMRRLYWTKLEKVGEIFVPPTLFYLFA